MEDKNIYLVVYTETEFYDPHGTPDGGGSTKDLEIIENGDWEANGYYLSYDKDDNATPYEPGVSYNEEGISRENDDTEYSGEDGYNCEVIWTSIRIITKEKYDEYKKIIEDYNKI